MTATAPEDRPFGTADEQDAFVELMVDDALKMERTSEIATKETTPIDTVVYPLSFATFMTRTKARGSEKNISDLIISRARYIKRIEFWHKGETLGAGGIRRVVGLAAQDEEAARFILPRAPTPGQRVQSLQGVAVPVNMVVGGFNTKIPESLIYMDCETQLNR